MITLKTISTLPPEGFKFYQPETNFWFTTHIDFWSRVDEIIAHRKMNKLPVTFDRNCVAKELGDFTCARLNNNPDICQDSDRKWDQPVYVSGCASCMGGR